MNFPEISPAHDPILYNNYMGTQFVWMSFPKIVPHPQIEISKKIVRVFQKNVQVTTRKTEISEKYLDEFTRICQ